MKKIFFIVLLFCYTFSNSQNWQNFTDSIATLSSPRSCDLNGDGILDIVIGGGTDSLFSPNGIMAYNGADGSLIWKSSSRDEIFGSAIFMDINSDSINDVIIAGRSAQLLAINGIDGTLIWEYFPYNVNPLDSGLLNFYNPQFVNDFDGDTYPDLLISNGGDHSAPSWQSNRPPGSLLIVSSRTGNLISQAIVPDSAETYCSPIVADIQNDGNQWILYGTGGENLGGHFYAVLIDDLVQGDLSNSIVLASDLNKGFIAPASIYKTEADFYNIIIQSFDGLVTKIDGSTFSSLWTYNKLGTESSAAPVIGNFTGDLTPDVLLVLFNGVAPSYNNYYQVMLDGNDGSVQFIDSLGVINFSSANAIDLNNDGRDEGVFSITYNDNGFFTTRVNSIDFTTNTISIIDQERTGVNISSTPLIADLDNNGLLDLVYCVKKDSLNPMGWKGINVYRSELNSTLPNAGIAWGSYMGTNADGIYSSDLVDCGFSIFTSHIVNPSCNEFSDGSIIIDPLGNLSSYTFLWSNQSTSSNIDSLQAGSYWIFVTDSIGCYELRTISLVDPFNITFGAISPPNCPGDSNGTATLSSTGCPCMFSGCTFLWDNGITTKNNPSLNEGWNSVIITHVGGCVVIDSVLINSAVYESDTSFSSDFACDSFAWDNIIYTNSGIYTNTYTNINGCDSVHTLNLTIGNSDSSSSVVSCDTYIWDGLAYTSSGTFSRLYTSIYGCDSIHTLNLIINNSSSGNSSVTSCDNYLWDGVFYTSSGIYSRIYTSASGCDSVHTLNLIINNSNIDTSSIFACGSYTWDNIIYTNSGIYTNTYTNINGCDSIHILELSISNIHSISNNISICYGDSIIVGDSIYNQSGIYTNFFNSTNGCDSTIVTQLTVYSDIFSILSQNDTNILVNTIGGTSPYFYVWSTGENTQQITPNGVGDYWVVITDINGCVADTSFYIVEWLSTNSLNFALDDISIYPNPSKDIFNISFNSSISQHIKLKITNVLGGVIFSKKLFSFYGVFDKMIDLGSYKKGVYLLEIETKDFSFDRKLILY